MLRNILIFPFVFFVVRFSISSHHETVLIWSERLEIIFQSAATPANRSVSCSTVRGVAAAAR